MTTAVNDSQHAVVMRLIRCMQDLGISRDDIQSMLAQGGPALLTAPGMRNTRCGCTCALCLTQLSLLFRILDLHSGPFLEDCIWANRPAVK